MMNCCGLLTFEKEPVPLKSIEVELEVRDHVATVVSTLNYENKEDKPLEAVFVFPLPGDAAVCHFSAQVGQTQIVVKLAAGHKFDRDVELLIYYKDAHQPTAVVEAGQASAELGSLMGDPVVMVSLYPEFTQSVMSSMASCGEFVFLVDRSGSMDCATNNTDYKTFPLTHLPMGCYFNIYSFGSRYEHIFSKSMEYSQKTMEEALKKVEEMEADLGGTEILEPLKHIYSQPCIQNQPRQLFVFTDGEVGNTKQVIDLVKKNSGSHRCFSFGIGEGASSALINGMAKEGGGHAQFITGTDRMQPKVMQSLRFALQPAVVDISVTWDLPKEVSVTVLSPSITTLFQGQRSLIYAQLTGQSSEAAEGCVTLKYSLAGHPSENQLHFSLRPAEDTGLTVHRLGAQTLIRSLEMEEREHRGQQGGGVKEKVVQLSVQSGVSSSFTAFVAVNKDNGEAIQGPLVQRNIPTAQHNECLHAFLRPLKDVGPQIYSSKSSFGQTHIPFLGRHFKEGLVSSPSPPDLWATILALIWIHGFKMDAKDEWELLAVKAASWLQAHKAPFVSECVDAGNVLLGCSVRKEALGL
uniref:VWFA domain-containing protein n=1 Tax=Haplochromis burtoni TaxID=8153 RepID=A0A3Q2WMF1_HAPBU